MNSSRKPDLVKALCRLSACLCSYTRQPCDCKFMRDEDTHIGGHHENGSGCPETAVAAQLIAHMTTQEFMSIARRAGINVHDDPEPPTPNVHEMIKNFQKDKWDRQVSLNPAQLLKKKTKRKLNTKSDYMPGKLPKAVL